MSKNHLIVGLDVSSSSIKLLIARSRPDKPGLEVFSKISKPSFGIRKGVVIDTEKVSEIISSVVKSAENDCGQKIEDVFVNIGGAHIFSTDSHGTIAVSRADQKISEEDIERVIQAAQTFSLPSNREILAVFPKEFIVDGEKEIKQPLGMEGVRLEAEILVLCYFAPYFNNLTKAVLDAGLQIGHMVCSPLASAEAVLSPRQKELGVLLIDIGAGTTGFCIFKEGVLIDVGIIPIGSFHITKDIATGLRTDIDTAERIKLQFGSCFLKGAKRFKIKEVSSGEPLVFSHSQLGKIIDARVSEIFQQIQKQAKKDSCSKLPGGAVLCGGGARLPKIKEFSKQALKMTSRLGKITGFSLKQDDSEWACASGLVLEGRKIMGDGGGPIQGVLEKLKRALKNFVP